MTTLSKEFESILEKYEYHKRNTYKVAELLGGDYVVENFGRDVYEKLVGCGTFLRFEKQQQEGGAVYHLKGANFCRQRLCPMCQFRRSEKMFAQMLEVVKYLEGEYRFIHLVLTVPNQKFDYELLQAIKILYKGFSLFYAYKSIRRAFKGVLRCLEVSYNYETNTFHPHLHCLVAVNKSYFHDSKVYLSYDKLRELWSKSVYKANEKLGYNAPFLSSGGPLQIHVGAIKQGDYSGVAEVCKYCVKPLELDKKGSEEQNKRLLLNLWHNLKGTRFLQKYGVIKETFSLLYGSEADEIESEEEINKNKKGLFCEWDSFELKYRGEKD